MNQTKTAFLVITGASIAIGILWFSYFRVGDIWAPGLATIQIHMDTDVYEKALKSFEDTPSQLRRNIDTWWEGHSMIIQRDKTSHHCHDIRWRPSGNSSRKITPWTPENGKEFEPFSLKIQSHQGCLGRTSWKLKSTQNITEALQEIGVIQMMQSKGIVTPRVNLARVEVVRNGEKRDFGLMLIEETIDDQFLQKHFDTRKGDLWKITARTDAIGNLVPSDISDIIGHEDEQQEYAPVYEFKGSKKHFEAAKKRLQDTIADIRDRPEYIFQNRLNTDSYIAHEAVNMLVSNIDGYWAQGNNYYLFLPKGSEKIHFIPVDFDKAFFGSWTGQRSGEEQKTYDIEVDAMVDVIYEQFKKQGDRQPRPLAQYMIINPTWRQKYHNHIISMLPMLDRSYWEQALTPWCHILYTSGTLESNTCTLSETTWTFLQKRQEFLTKNLKL